MKWLRCKKIFCIKCNKYTKFKNLKISYIFDKTLILFIICSKCGSKYKIPFKEGENQDIKNSCFN